MQVGRHALPLLGNGQPSARRVFLAQPVRQLLQARGPRAIAPHCASREPGCERNPDEEPNVARLIEEGRDQQRRAGEHGELGGVPLGVSPEGIKRRQKQHHAAVGLICPDIADGPVEHKHQHQGQSRHYRRATPKHERQRRERSRDRAARTEAAQQDLQLDNGTQPKSYEDVRASRMRGLRADRVLHVSKLTADRPAVIVRITELRSTERLSPAPPESTGIPRESTSRRMASAHSRRSVGGMFNTSRISNPDAPRNAVLVVAGALIINALVFSPLGDEWFFAIALLGPLATGLVAGARRQNWHLVAAAWALSGTFWLVIDWIVNNEDQIFHIVLAVVMVALTALGAGIGRAVLALTRKAKGPAMREAH